MTESPQETYEIELQNASFQWQLGQGQLHFFGLPAVLFWLNPSMLDMLQPFASEVGTPLFRLLIAERASRGTDSDYHAMVTTLGSTFEEGFLAWGRAVSAAGWGAFELHHYDTQRREATVVVRNPWELQMQQGQAQQWGCPFLQGKLIGIFSHALGITCWADEEFIDVEGQPAVRFHLRASATTITGEMARLREQRIRHEQQHLAAEIQRVAQQLQEAQQEQVRIQEQALQTQAALIAELSTPLIPITDHVVMMPLIGHMDSQRAQRVIDTLLQGISQQQAAFAILDITGLPIVDTGVANILLQAAQAVQLLGTTMIITGIRPEVAQTLVGLGADLGKIITLSSLQSGIAYALRQTS
ncbi:STAS domain-containing protein [Chloroflexia bacterium SDU3-3]|nr:STAS domain-containing protein [Chloroflexia bacterium SDU3-3]